MNLTIENINLTIKQAQSAGIVKYNDCISTGE